MENCRGYIYQIIANIPPKNQNGIYVGQTILTIAQRFTRHCRYPDTKHCYIDRYIKKHGATSVGVFEIEKVTGFSKKNLVWRLNQREIFWIAYHGSYGRGFNLTKGGDGGSPFLNHKHTDEAKKKISKAGKGKAKSQDHKDKIGKSKEGKKRSPFSVEWRKNMSNSKQGSKNSNFGKHLSEDAAKIRGEAKKKYYWDHPEVVEKIRATLCKYREKLERGNNRG